MKKRTPGITKTFFFDDRSENLIVPKKLGWITVLVNPLLYKKNENYHHIDFIFPDIYKALEYFYIEINNNKNKLKK